MPDLNVATGRVRDEHTQQCHRGLLVPPRSPSPAHQLGFPPPVPHESISNLSASPALEVTCLKTASAVGLLQMFPRQTKRTRVLPPSPAIISDVGRFPALTGGMLAVAAARANAGVLLRREARRGAGPPLASKGGARGDAVVGEVQRVPIFITASGAVVGTPPL